MTKQRNLRDYFVIQWGLVVIGCINIMVGLDIRCWLLLRCWRSSSPSIIGVIGLLWVGMWQG